MIFGSCISRIIAQRDSYDRPMPAGERYVPATGRLGLDALYDPLIALTMRERAFRGALVEQALAAPAAHELLDLGCGTGAIALALARAAPSAHVHALDGDEAILARARRKTEAAGVEVDFVHAFADALPFADSSINRVVSSLLFHHLAPETKARALAECRRVLHPGGRLHVADWGRPHDPLLRVAFLGLQLIDGFQNTRDHAAGRLPDMIAAAGFNSVAVTDRYRTVFGTLELIAAVRD
jgi:SAM-dependent methyltransferase